MDLKKRVATMDIFESPDVHTPWWFLMDEILFLALWARVER